MKVQGNERFGGSELTEQKNFSSFFLNSKEAETSRHKINEHMRACILTVKAPQHIGKGQRIKPPRLSLFLLF